MNISPKSGAKVYPMYRHILPRLKNWKFPQCVATLRSPPWSRRLVVEGRDARKKKKKGEKKEEEEKKTDEKSSTDELGIHFSVQNGAKVST